MALYQITSKAGVDFGVCEARSEAEALFLRHLDAGYTHGEVRLADATEDHALIFRDDESRNLLGDLGDWDVEEVEECAYCGAWVSPYGRVPDQDDDDAWRRLGIRHEDDCEWISTRAHQLYGIPGAGDGDE